jgi:hypothetical protein
MRSRANSYILVLAILIVFLSLTALFVNHAIYRYPANNYFPENTLRIGCSLLLVYFGFFLLIGNKARITLSVLELLRFFAVMCLIALATNTVQLTPFVPIDKKIVQFETFFHFDMSVLLVWMHQHPVMITALGFVYDSLTYQMCILPLFVLAMGRFETLKEYYLLLLWTTLIGFCFYYFYPTTAPASIIHSPYFTPYQMATFLKFNQIHHYIRPTTLEGGLIAFPSFHCIWALLCVYLIKDWPIPCFVLLMFNTLLIASCVLLGWHYPSDILAGIILVGVVCYFIRRS